MRQRRKAGHRSALFWALASLMPIRRKLSCKGTENWARMRQSCLHGWQRVQVPIHCLASSRLLQRLPALAYLQTQAPSLRQLASSGSRERTT